MNCCRYACYWLIAALLILSSSLATAATLESTTLPKIVLVGTQDTHDSPIGQWLELIYTTAFKRLGYQLVYESYPSKRASLISDSGEADGEIFRFFEYADTHPNLIRVNESPFSVNWVAYSINIKTPLDGWNSLSHTTYRVGYRDGSRKLEYELPKVLSPTQLKPAVSTLSGLEMLSAHRTDIFIEMDQLAQTRLANIHDHKQHIYPVGLMENCPMYAFLHKRHQNLVAPLEKIIKQMKDEGLIEQYRISAGFVSITTLP